MNKNFLLVGLGNPEKNMKKTDIISAVILLYF